ncbi:MAG: hypothetical protein A2X48_04235 [Lentisphaerae bacterium GWF2_49_21]|nr:MAG: hypothetical protein A2X48_04235 [Lentisphaerae bacterium GWF2_49_21]
MRRAIAISCFTASVLVAGVTASNTVTQWKENFQFDGKAAGKILPKGWEIKSKIGTPAAEFYLVKDGKENLNYLHMESDKSSASVICSPEKINLKETPIIKWRWRVSSLPEGADGREEKKDDQAIGIYIGTGSLLSKKSVSYRWDTETPKGAEGNCSYGAGTIRIKWFTLRNKDDAAGEWFTEERNVGEDFNKAWGYYPDEIYVSISCNSQYTGTKSSADLNWIELLPASEGKK